MTFSLRLTADLSLALAARAFRNKQSHPAILRVSPDADLESVAAGRAPILWIAGSEPLDYPDVARLTNALAVSLRTVFLETSGASLKRRLHEFRPSSHFYFAVRFENVERSPDQSDAPETAFRTGIEAIRMARLAGFFACAHFTVRPGATIQSIEGLHAEISKLGVDGFLITAAAPSPEPEAAVKLLRRRLLNWRSALLSGLVESISLPVASRNTLESDPPSISEPQRESLGESVEAR
jgi:hypothetical protein